MGWEVRRATPADADEIARVNVASWRTAYRGLVPGAVLDGMDPAARIPGWRRATDQPEPSALFVAVVPGTAAVAAYCLVAAARTEDDRLGAVPTGELVAIYADPAHLGAGAGHAVHEAGVARLAGSGFRHAVLWVFADNPSSHAFYRAHGWQPDGATRQQPIGDVVLPVVRFARGLSG